MLLKDATMLIIMIILFASSLVMRPVLSFIEDPNQARVLSILLDIAFIVPIIYGLYHLVRHLLRKRKAGQASKEMPMPLAYKCAECGSILEYNEEHFGQCDDCHLPICSAECFNRHRDNNIHVVYTNQ